MIDIPAHQCAERAHTAKLAALPGWRDYIEHKARGMARKYPALYADLPALVAATPIREDGVRADECIAEGLSASTDQTQTGDRNGWTTSFQ